MICMVLAAGYATRLYPLTENFPKPLLDVGGKSILDRLLEDIDKQLEITGIVVISNHKFINHFEQWKRKSSFKNSITVIDDGSTDNDNRLGAVKDIQFAIERLDINDDLLIIAGDNVVDFSFGEFICFAKEKNTSCVMCHKENDIQKLQKTAVITKNNNGLITSYEEKPQKPKGDMAVPPFYFYKNSDIKRIEESIADGCNTDAPGSFAAWLSSKTDMYAWEMTGNRYDIGDLKSYRTVQKIFLRETLYA